MEPSNSIDKMNNALESIGNTSKAEEMEERISELKGRNLKMIQVEEDRELRGFFIFYFIYLFLCVCFKLKNSMRIIRLH